MKPLALLSVVFVIAMALGIAVGLSGWGAASLDAKVNLGLTTLFGGLLLFSAWLWIRAEPGSPDKQSTLTLMMTSGIQVLWYLPRVIAPDGGWLRAVGYDLAFCATAGFLTRLYLQRRRRRTAA